MNDVRGINNAASLVQEGISSAHAAKSNVGELSGASVQVAESPEASLADSAEELTFARDNSKQTKLKDRKQKQAALNLEEKIEKMKQAFELQTDNDDRNQKSKLLEDLRAGKENRESMLNRLKEQGGHPASNYFFLLQYADNEKDPSFAEKIKDLAQALYTDEKSEIDACINTISVAGHNDLSSSFDLCLSYSELSHDCKTPVEMLHYIEKKFGADKVDAGIDFMFEALSADLASVNQSQEQVLLESVGTSLSLARSINGASVILNSFVERFDKIYHLDSGNLNGFSLLERMLKLSEQKFIQTSQVRSLYTEVSKQDPETEVLMAQDLLNKSRELGSEVFFGVENRAHVIDAVQSLVDKLIEKEDEWLEQGGN